ncbi:hypothetical protein BN6_11540 [Saccharothrix espanaensis DSM 44229]|uniref:Uncharacterized protein n=1 Tax=Saccharothrix espanaensis (strain ATCC 51144 / DSM 44229 / JCM 9112 / NBRC 15066 / NRRL 15764) TaxID=1179773 RepID=K0JPC3_SACES|nr:hypothetical protein BN6_11540 [Saccharothrix espanaensis DSM 44229]
MLTAKEDGLHSNRPTTTTQSRPLRRKNFTLSPDPAMRITAFRADVLRVAPLGGPRSDEGTCSAACAMPRTERLDRGIAPLAVAAVGLVVAQRAYRTAEAALVAFAWPATRR